MIGGRRVARRLWFRHRLWPAFFGTVTVCKQFASPRRQVRTASSIYGLPSGSPTWILKPWSFFSNRPPLRGERKVKPLGQRGILTAWRDRSPTRRSRDRRRGRTSGGSNCHDVSSRHEHLHSGSPTEAFAACSTAGLRLSPTTPPSLHVCPGCGSRIGRPHDSDGMKKRVRKFFRSRARKGRVTDQAR
jgi:hypothetical protein